MRRNELVNLWNHASVKVMDVRHQIVQPTDIFSYASLPSSVFVYAVRGQAEVLLDELVYSVNGCHVIHGGKGHALEIVPQKTEFEFYILFYKAVIPLPCRQEIKSLLETRNWFLLSYDFVPQQSIVLLDKLEKLQDIWQQVTDTAVQPLYAKALFQLFVAELLEQMHGTEEGERVAIWFGRPSNSFTPITASRLRWKPSRKSCATASRICPSNSSNRQATARLIT